VFDDRAKADSASALGNAIFVILSPL